MGAALGVLLLRSCATPPPRPDATPAQPVPLIQVQSMEDVLYKMDTLYAERYSIPVEQSTLIRTAARTHHIPLPIAYHLIWVESRFNRLALSHAGARGLVQLMPRTAMYHCTLWPHELWTPALNIPCGFSYLHMLHVRYRSWPQALAAYNVGPGRLYKLRHTGARYASLVLRRPVN